ATPELQSRELRAAGEDQERGEARLDGRQAFADRQRAIKERDRRAGDHRRQDVPDAVRHFIAHAAPLRTIRIVVTPAKAGIQAAPCLLDKPRWIPAFAGMTSASAC